MTGFEQSEIQRMERVGELLAPRHQSQGSARSAGKSTENRPDVSEHSDPVLIFVSQVGEATPKDIREQIGLSRSTAFRGLEALVALGKLFKFGTTRNSLYLLAGLAIK